MNYQYNTLGRRVVRQDKQTGQTEFTHDGLDVIQDRFEKSDGTNSTTSYVNGLGIDDKLKQTSGTTSKYFLTDHLGSTTGLTDSSGSVTESASYDSFGNKTGSLSTRYGYTGREQDEAMGLMYYRARFYDPQIGRFTSEDLIGFEGSDVNLYGYVGNNPIMRIDPMGLDWNDDWEWAKNKADEWSFKVLAYSAQVAAGFGDTVSLGLTRKVRQWMGTDHVIIPCSNWYFAGEVTGTVLPMFIGGAGAVRGALAMGGRSGSIFTRLTTGARRFFHDPRTFNAIRQQYWSRTTGFGPANGWHLHHWFIPQRSPLGPINAGWNLITVPGRFNSWMGYSLTWGRATELALRAAIPAFPVGGVVQGGVWGMERQEWKSECECK